MFRIKRFLLYTYQYWKLKLNSDSRFKMNWSDRKIMLEDNTKETSFDRHYTYFSAWAIRKIKDYNPDKHVDISSSLIFSALLSAFIVTEFYDLRPAKIFLSNLVSKKANIVNLPLEDNSIASLSCMHVIEHVGLGRYGDKLDTGGDKKAAKELVRVLAKGGNLLIVVPVGKPKIQFNAHRIYGYGQVIDIFDSLRLREFSLIPDKTNKGIIVDAKSELVKKCDYACGCFWFVKE